MNSEEDDSRNVFVDSLSLAQNTAQKKVVEIESLTNDSESDKFSEKIEYIMFRIEMLSYFIKNLKRELKKELSNEEFGALLAGGIIPYITTLVDTMFSSESVLEKVNEFLNRLRNNDSNSLFT